MSSPDSRPRGDPSLPTRRPRADSHLVPSALVAACHSCSADFSAEVRKYHCQCCGNVYCATCTPHRAMIPNISSSPVRVCEVCIAYVPSASSAPAAASFSAPVSAPAPAPRRGPRPPHRLRRAHTLFASELQASPAEHVQAVLLRVARYRGPPAAAPWRSVPVSSSAPAVAAAAAATHERAVALLQARAARARQVLQRLQAQQAAAAGPGADAAAGAVSTDALTAAADAAADDAAAAAAALALPQPGAVDVIRRERLRDVARARATLLRAAAPAGGVIGPDLTGTSAYDDDGCFDDQTGSSGASVNPGAGPVAGDKAFAPEPGSTVVLADQMCHGAAVPIAVASSSPASAVTSAAAPDGTLGARTLLRALTVVSEIARRRQALLARAAAAAAAAGAVAGADAARLAADAGLLPAVAVCGPGVAPAPEPRRKPAFGHGHGHAHGPHSAAAPGAASASVPAASAAVDVGFSPQRAVVRGGKAADAAAEAETMPTPPPALRAVAQGAGASSTDAAAAARRAQKPSQSQAGSAAPRAAMAPGFTAAFAQIEEYFGGGGGGDDGDGGASSSAAPAEGGQRRGSSTAAAVASAPVSRLRTNSQASLSPGQTPSIGPAVSPLSPSSPQQQPASPSGASSGAFSLLSGPSTGSNLSNPSNPSNSSISSDIGERRSLMSLFALPTDTAVAALALAAAHSPLPPPATAAVVAGSGPDGTRGGRGAGSFANTASAALSLAAAGGAGTGAGVVLGVGIGVGTAAASLPPLPLADTTAAIVAAHAAAPSHASYRITAPAATTAVSSPIVAEAEAAVLGQLPVAQHGPLTAPAAAAAFAAGAGSGPGAGPVAPTSDPAVASGAAAPRTTPGSGGPAPLWLAASTPGVLLLTNHQVVFVPDDIDDSRAYGHAAPAATHAAAARARYAAAVVAASAAAGPTSGGAAAAAGAMPSGTGTGASSGAGSGVGAVADGVAGSSYGYSLPWEPNTDDDDSDTEADASAKRSTATGRRGAPALASALRSPLHASGGAGHADAELLSEEDAAFLRALSLRAVIACRPAAALSLALAAAAWARRERAVATAAATALVPCGPARARARRIRVPAPFTALASEELLLGLRAAAAGSGAAEAAARDAAALLALHSDPSAMPLQHVARAAYGLAGRDAAWIELTGHDFSVLRFYVEGLSERAVYATFGSLVEAAAARSQPARAGGAAVMSMLAFTGADTIKRARRRASHVRTVPHLQPTLLLPPPPPPRPQTLEEEYLSVAFAPPVPAGTAAGGAHALLGSGVDTTTSPLLEAVLHASAHAHAADASLLGAVHRSFAAAPYADRSRACATVDATYSASYGSLPFSLPSAVGPESPAPSQLGSPPAPALATALAHRWWVSPRLNGWLLYSPIIEYRRLGIPSARYQLSFINDTHAFCPSYPDVLALPRGLTPAELEAAAAFRSHRRVPVVVWAHPTAPLAGTAAVPVAAVTGTDAAAGVAVVPISATVRAPNPAVLLRASQPAVGVLGARCAADELLLQACVGLGGVLVVADARRKINALAQFVAKGGFESPENYEAGPLRRLRVEFLNIGNVKAARKAHAALGTLVAKVSDIGRIPSDWHAQLHATGYVEFIAALLHGATYIASSLKQGTSVLVHCTDGWDRTPQLTALAQLMLDPFYRTLPGFLILIEKEWLSFGHRFADRTGFAGFTTTMPPPTAGTAGAASAVAASASAASAPAVAALSSGPRPNDGSSGKAGKDAASTHSPHSAAATVAAIAAASAPAAGDADALSPAFLMFLDCVSQLVRQYPCEFEFTASLLPFIADSMTSGLYGTFMLNSVAERIRLRLHLQTRSLWTAVHARRLSFRNPLYAFRDASCPQLEPALERVDLWAEYYLRWLPAAATASTETVLRALVLRPGLPHRAAALAAVPAADVAEERSGDAVEAGSAVRSLMQLFPRAVSGGALSAGVGAAPSGPGAAPSAGVRAARSLGAWAAASLADVARRAAAAGVSTPATAAGGAPALAPLVPASGGAVANPCFSHARSIASLALTPARVAVAVGSIEASTALAPMTAGEPLLQRLGWEIEERDRAIMERDVALAQRDAELGALRAQLAALQRQETPEQASKHALAHHTPTEAGACALAGSEQHEIYSTPPNIVDEDLSIPPRAAPENSP